MHADLPISRNQSHEGGSDDPDLIKNYTRMRLATCRPCRC
uniref:Uncharacterized protein n=1 Tax=Arundo donax TaxID=35708 RepID=A0A0A9G4L7_ARUDO